MSAREALNHAWIQMHSVNQSESINATCFATESNLAIDMFEVDFIEPISFVTSIEVMIHSSNIIYYPIEQSFNSVLISSTVFYQEFNTQVGYSNLISIKLINPKRLNHSEEILP